jgi:predicted dehydrogenase
MLFSVLQVLTQRNTSGIRRETHMEQIRYGIVGARSTGIVSEHQRAILNVPGIYLAALCNRDPKELAEAAELVPHPVERYASAEDMFAKASLDAVIIATPNYNHRDLTLKAFAAGLHVLCEKPLATTLEECDEIIAAGKQANRLLQVGLHRRYRTIYTRLAGLIEQGELGRPVMMWSQEFRGDWSQRFADDPEQGRINWRYSQRLSGGTLVEKTCHDFDVFNWFGGGLPTRVSASGGLSIYEGRETLDHAIVNLEYPSGLKANLQLSLFVPHGFHGRYAGLVGERGSVKILEGSDEMFQYFRDRSDAVHYQEGPLQGRQGHGIGVYAQNAAFADCIRRGIEPFATGEVGKASVAVALAAEQSIQTGKEVILGV